MFLMNAFMGVNGIVWATPIADFAAMIIAILLFIPVLIRIKEPKNNEYV